MESGVVDYSYSQDNGSISEGETTITADENEDKVQSSKDKSDCDQKETTKSSQINELELKNDDNTETQDIEYSSAESKDVQPSIDEKTKSEHTEDSSTESLTEGSEKSTDEHYNERKSAIVVGAIKLPEQDDHVSTTDDKANGSLHKDKAAASTDQETDCYSDDNKDKDSSDDVVVTQSNNPDDSNTKSESDKEDKKGTCLGDQDGFQEEIVESVQEEDFEQNTESENSVKKAALVGYDSQDTEDETINFDCYSRNFSRLTGTVSDDDYLHTDRKKLFLGANSEDDIAIKYGQMDDEVYYFMMSGKFINELREKKQHLTENEGKTEEETNNVTSTAGSSEISYQNTENTLLINPYIEDQNTEDRVMKCQDIVEQDTKETSTNRNDGAPTVYEQNTTVASSTEASKANQQITEDTATEDDAMDENDSGPLFSEMEDLDENREQIQEILSSLNTVPEITTKDDKGNIEDEHEKIDVGTEKQNTEIDSELPIDATPLTRLSIQDVGQSDSTDLDASNSTVRLAGKIVGYNDSTQESIPAMTIDSNPKVNETPESDIDYSDSIKSSMHVESTPQTASEEMVQEKKDNSENYTQYREDSIKLTFGNSLSTKCKNSSEENLDWFLENFQIVPDYSTPKFNDILCATCTQLLSTSGKYIPEEDLKAVVIAFARMRRPSLEKFVRQNLKDRQTTYDNYLRCFEDGNSNGMDVTLKILSGLIRQHIAVLIGDTIWLDMNIELNQVGLFYIYENSTFYGCWQKNREPIIVDMKYLRNYYKVKTTQEVHQPEIDLRYQAVCGSQDGQSTSQETQNNEDKYDETPADKCTEAIQQITAGGVIQCTDSAEQHTEPTSVIPPSEDSCTEAFQQNTEPHLDLTSTETNKQGTDGKHDIATKRQVRAMKASTPNRARGVQKEPKLLETHLSPIHSQQHDVLKEISGNPQQQPVFPPRDDDFSKMVNTESVIAIEPSAYVLMKYKCKKCRCLFLTENEYFKHIFEVHRCRSKKRNPPDFQKTFVEIEGSTPGGHHEEVYQPDDDLECGICEQVLFSHKTLRNHMENHHRHFTPFLCAFCEMLFFMEEKFLSHLEIHANEYIPEKNTSQTKKPKKGQLDDPEKTDGTARQPLENEKQNTDGQAPLESEEQNTDGHAALQSEKQNTDGNDAEPMKEDKSKTENINILSDAKILLDRLPSGTKPYIPKSFCCPICPETFFFEKGLEIHMTSHKRKPKKKQEDSPNKPHVVMTRSRRKLISSQSNNEDPEMTKQSQDLTAQQNKDLAEYWRNAVKSQSTRKKKNIMLKRSKEFFDRYLQLKENEKIIDNTSQIPTEDDPIPKKKHCDRKVHFEDIDGTGEQHTDQTDKTDQTEDIAEVSADANKEQNTEARQNKTEKKNTTSDDTGLGTSESSAVPKDDKQNLSPESKDNVHSASNIMSAKGEQNSENTQHDSNVLPGSSKGTEQDKQNTEKKGNKTDEKTPTQHDANIDPPSSKVTGQDKQNSEDNEDDPPPKSFTTKDPRCKTDANLLNEKKYNLRTASTKRKHLDGDDSQDKDWEPDLSKSTDSDVTVNKEKTLPPENKRSRRNADSSSEDDADDDQNTENQHECTSEEEDMNYPCLKCTATFNDHDEYVAHKEKCFKKKKKFLCPKKKCGKTFAEKAMMIDHYDYRHTSKPKKYVCKLCNKSFPYKRSLTLHNDRKHTDDDKKSFMCDQCGKLFAKKWEYQNHRRGSHSDLKPFQCGICKMKAFTTAGRLQSHLKHCGKEPDLECNVCGKKFAIEHNFSRHVREHHNKMSKYTCPICGMDYGTEGGYFGHLREVHKIGRKYGRTLKTIKVEQLIQEEENAPSQAELNQKENATQSQQNTDPTKSNDPKDTDDGNAKSTNSSKKNEDDE